LGEKLQEKLQNSRDSGTSAHAWKDRPIPGKDEKLRATQARI